MRRITGTYETTKDTYVCVRITDCNGSVITVYENAYNVKHCGDNELYNKILDDFNAEYDESLASVIENLVDNMMKEGVFDDEEDSTQN